MAKLDIGLARAKVGRLSVAGELGYELNCHASEHLTLYRTLRDACLSTGGAEIGVNAVLSLRMEKSFGIWNAEFMQAYTPGETGLGRWIDFGKGEFIGKEAAAAERVAGPSRRLVTLELEEGDSDATGYEPVWSNGRRVGYVTSGAYGHTVGKSLAMALVEAEFAGEGTELLCHVVGKGRSAMVIPPSPHDPKGLRMRQ